MEQKSLPWLHQVRRTDAQRVWGMHSILGLYCQTVLKYDLQSGQISRMELPTGCVRSKPRVFTTTEGGALGIATIRRDYKLYIWFREDTGYSSRWIQTRVIKLERLLPVDAFFGSAERPYVVGFAYRIGLLFFWANNVLYTVHVKTCEVKKLYKGHTIYNVVPYMSFYTPGTPSLSFWFYNILNEQYMKWLHAFLDAWMVCSRITILQKWNITICYQTGFILPKSFLCWIIYGTCFVLMVRP